MKLTIGKHQLVSKTHLKYLGVVIDARLNFKAHIEYIHNKASNVRAALDRMMPNVGGPKQYKRKILSTVISSVILYAAPIWSRALNVKSTARKLLSVYRLTALRVCCAYRTTSDDAAYVIAGMLPIDILADERKRLYSLGRNDSDTRKTQRDASIAAWQKRWEESRKGRWTFRLIPNLNIWLNRKHGEVNYYLSQFLSGHGGYRKYLHRFKLDDSPYCPHCPNTEEDAEHVIFYCPRFTQERQQTEEVIGKRLNTQNIVDALLAKAENWNLICGMIKGIHEKLTIEEKHRKELRATEV